MERTLIDNSCEELSMCRFLKECIQTDGIDTIRIATGYWDIPGTALIIDELEEFLEKGKTKIKLLIGEDPTVRAYQLKNPKYAKGAHYPQDYIRTDLMEIEVKPDYVRVVNFLKQYCVGNNPRFEIHIYTNRLPHGSTLCDVEAKKEGFNYDYANDEDESRFLHSKCYIFTSDVQSKAYAVVGSSNFTRMGLVGNSELNYLENDSMRVAAPSSPFRDQKSFLMWYNEKWERSEDWTREFIEEILKGTPVNEASEEHPVELQEDPAPLTPYELYIKLLQTKYGHIVDKNLNQHIASYLPTRYDCYSYQIDAVKQCYATMIEHGGFLLADVVGLGKTIVGTLLIKHFLLCPDEYGHEPKVLIITPPAIQSAWRNTIEDFDADTDFKIAPFIDYITTGSIGKLTDDEDEESIDTGEFEGELKHENYGLIIIDESHKFRNSTNGMYIALDTLIGEIGSETGAYPYIGLLSATPQNNRPSDLQNQIYLFERNRSDCSLKNAKNGNLEGFFSEINTEYSSLIHPKDDDDMTPEQRQQELKSMSKTIRDCVLTDIMVRRTRTDVLTYYKEDMDNQGITFPEIVGPVSMEYKMSPKLARLFYDSMSNIAPNEGESGLMYYRYRAIQYLSDPEVKAKYDARGSRNADALAEQLAKIMQMNLVKRLESSFTAFMQSLLNLKQYTQNMIDMWERDSIFICPQFNVNDELDRKKIRKKIAKKQKVDESKVPMPTLESCFDNIRKRIAKLNEEGRNDEGTNMEYHRSDFDDSYIKLLRHDYEIINDLCDRWAHNSEDPKFDVFKDNLRTTLFDKETNRPQKLVIFTEAIDTADSITAAAEAKGFSVLKITAANRNERELDIRKNFDANYKGEWKYDYDIIVTTDVLAEGINLHRANCILNYDTPWNSTRLMQRIGRVNRIGSPEKEVYVYNFMPSAQGDAEIELVQKAHTKLQSFHTLFGEDSQIFSEEEEVMHYGLKKFVDGEKSAFEKYIYELKQFKQNAPERYAIIEQSVDGLQLATAPTDGFAYFLVRTPRLSGMFVKVDQTDCRGKIISAQEMYEHFRCSEDATRTELPVNWDKIVAAAERTMNKHLHKLNTRMGKSKKATKAKAILDRMKGKEMSQKSFGLLSDAYELVNKGNPDIINKIISFDGQNHSAQLSIWNLTQEDFDHMIETEISRIVSTVRARYGKAEVFIGLNK